MIIDAHQHFWKLDDARFDHRWLDAPPLAPIRRDYLPDDLRPHLANAGVDRTVFVQTQHNVEETRWVLDLTKQHAFLAGVVGWVDLASDQCEAQLDELLAHPKFVGVRHVTQDERDDDFIVSDDVSRGLALLEQRGVPFDLLFYVKHLRHAATVAARFPSLPLVIDHLAKPEIKAGRLDNWVGHFRDAARFPNVYCKLSGMVTEADWRAWRPADLRPYVEVALEAFGPSRCMFGSDWPVCEVAATYERTREALAELIGELSPTEQARVWGGTAVAFYGLDIAASEREDGRHGA